jgi:hypothetical protein
MYNIVLCLNMDAQQRQMENHVQCVVPLEVSARKKTAMCYFFMFSSNNIA